MTPKQSPAAFALNMAIHANLDSLTYQLDSARQLALDARHAMEEHQRRRHAIRLAQIVARPVGGAANVNDEVPA